MGGNWARIFWNNYKGHMDKTKRGRNQSSEVGMAGMAGMGDGSWELHTDFCT